MKNLHQKMSKWFRQTESRELKFFRDGGTSKKLLLPQKFF